MTFTSLSIHIPLRSEVSVTDQNDTYRGNCAGTDVNIYALTHLTLVRAQRGKDDDSPHFTGDKIEA